jgi:hypothetical protein
MLIKIELLLKVIREQNGGGPRKIQISAHHSPPPKVASIGLMRIFTLIVSLLLLSVLTVVLADDSEYQEVIEFEYEYSEVTMAKQTQRPKCKKINGQKQDDDVEYEYGNFVQTSSEPEYESQSSSELEYEYESSQSGEQQQGQPMHSTAPEHSMTPNPTHVKETKAPKAKHTKKPKHPTKTTPPDETLVMGAVHTAKSPPQSSEGLLAVPWIIGSIIVIAVAVTIMFVVRSWRSRPGYSAVELEFAPRMVPIEDRSLLDF